MFGINERGKNPLVRDLVNEFKQRASAKTNNGDSAAAAAVVGQALFFTHFFFYFPMADIHLFSSSTARAKLRQMSQEAANIHKISAEF